MGIQINQKVNGMKTLIKKYPVTTGLLLSVINCILLLSLLFFTRILQESINWGSHEAGLASMIIYCGTVYLSFLFNFSIQATYKIVNLENGFLFRILCVFNSLELFVLLRFFFLSGANNMFLFIVLIITISVLKIITVRIYHFLYPRNKEIDSILYWGDLWKGIFISIIITCVVMFLIIMIIISNLW